MRLCINFYFAVSRSSSVWHIAKCWILTFGELLDTRRKTPSSKSNLLRTNVKNEWNYFGRDSQKFRLKSLRLNFNQKQKICSHVSQGWQNFGRTFWALAFQCKFYSASGGADFLDMFGLVQFHFFTAKIQLFPNDENGKKKLGANERNFWRMLACYFSSFG